MEPEWLTWSTEETSLCPMLMFLTMLLAAVSLAMGHTYSTRSAPLPRPLERRLSSLERQVVSKPPARGEGTTSRQRMAGWKASLRMGAIKNSLAISTPLAAQ